jgi:hypothetical protein
MISGRRISPLNRQRYIALTIGAGAIAAISAIFLVGAPPIPAAIGITVAVAYLLWRTPAK